MIEPFYHLNYTSGECLFKLYLNEIVIIDNISGVSDKAGSCLLNFYIFNSGTQSLQFEIFPKKGSINFNINTFIEISLYRSDQTNNFLEKEYLIKKNTISPPNLFFEKEFNTPPVFWNLEFNAEVPYNNSLKWLESREIKEIPNFENKIKKTYSQIYQTVLEENVTGLYEMFKANMLRIKTCLYENNKEEANNFQIMENLIKQKPIAGKIYKLQPFEAKILRIYGTGKITDMLREDGSPILFFKQKPKDVTGATIDVRLFSYDKEIFEIL